MLSLKKKKPADLLAGTKHPTLTPDELKDWAYVNDLQKIMVGWIDKNPT